MTPEPILVTRFFAGTFDVGYCPAGAMTFTYVPPPDTLDGHYALPLAGTPWILPHWRVN